MALARRLLVVLALAGAGFVPAPAMAAGYCTGSGVSVVVDFGALGGGIQKGCDASGNRNAASAFVNTGHPLDYATRQPGFVCRVDGVPKSDPCYNTSPSNAYWGLYWSDGKSGWTYSSLGARSLDVPAGATVAFSWQNGGTADPPGTAPAPPASTISSPKASPTRTPTATTRPKSTTAGAAASAAATSGVPTHPASMTPTPTPTPTSPTSSVSASATPSADAATPSADPTTASAAGPLEAKNAAEDNGGGLPWWVPVIVLLAVLGGAGGAWWRRRASG